MRKKSISKNIIFNVSYKILNILFPLITSVYLARILGPSNIGKVSYATSVMSYFLIFASLGIPAYGIREIAKARDNPGILQKTFSELFLLNCISSLICSGIFVILVFSIESFSNETPLFICVGITLFFNVFNVDWFYSGMEEYIYITVRSFIIKLLAVISVFLFIKSPEDYIIYALILSLATTCNYFLNVINLKKKTRLSLKEIDLSKHLKPIIILLVATIATDIYLQMDVTMLGIIRTSEEVGYYSYGIKIVRIVSSISQAIGATTIPRLSNSYNKGETEEYKSLFWKIINIIAIVSFPACVGIFILAPEIVICLFSDQFIPTIGVMRILSIQTLIVSFSYAIGSVVLTSTNNEKCLLRASITGCLVNLILNSLLIPMFGISGAAIASVAAEIAVLFVHAYYGHQFIGRRLGKKNIVSILLSVSIMLIFVLLFQCLIEDIYLRLIICTLLGMLVYICGLFCFKNTFAVSFYMQLTEKIKKIMKRKTDSTNMGA